MSNKLTETNKEKLIKILTEEIEFFEYEQRQYEVWISGNFDLIVNSVERSINTIEQMTIESIDNPKKYFRNMIAESFLQNYYDKKSYIEKHDLNLSLFAYTMAQAFINSINVQRKVKIEVCF